MKQSHRFLALAGALIVGFAGIASAGAPQPDNRAGDFVHVCARGANKGQTCTIATQDTDCAGSDCVVQTLSKPIKGTLTLIAHDEVTDWRHGGATNRAATVLLEVRAPDGSKQLLAATYQELATPTNPPEAPANVISIPLDETALKVLTGAVGGLRFAQPETTLSQQLQELFNVTGTPVIVAAADHSVDSADHTADGLATVLRLKVKIQFVEPA